MEMSTQEQFCTELSQTRDIGIQCEVQQREYIPAWVQSTFFHESEGWQIFYRSRTISSMGFLLAFIYITSHIFQGENLEQSILNGFLFAAFAFCVYGMIYFPNGMIQRPHPIFWRLLQSWAVIYLACVIFTIYLSPEQLQQFLKRFIDDNLGKPLPQKSYAEDCRVYTPERENKFSNIADSVDVFFSAHLIGWTVKMLILRDFKLAMFQQITFEFMEITFRHWLPNFWECWWDHLILDVLLCNTGGIILGWYLMRKFGMKQYKWSFKEKEELTFFQNFKRLCLQPQLDVQEWKVFSSVKRFISVVWFMIFMNLCDLSFFFNKYILQINTNHTIMKLRVFPLGFYSIVAAREYYIYITDPTVTRMGANAWLMHMIVLSEWLLFAKNYQGQFTAPFPSYVILSWTLILSVFVYFIVLIYKSQKKPKLG